MTVVGPPDLRALHRLPVAARCGEVARASPRPASPTTPGLRELAALSCLADQGAIPQRRLSELCDVSPTLIVRLVDGLEAKGLVSRERSATDRRLQVVQLTPDGQRRPGRPARQPQGRRTRAGRAAHRRRDQATQASPAGAARRQRGPRRQPDGRSPGLPDRARPPARARGRGPAAGRARPAPAGLRAAVDAAAGPALLAGAPGRPDGREPAGDTRPAGLPRGAPGLVARSRSEQDRRVQQISLTPAGRTTLAQAQRTAATIQQEIADRLGPEADADLRSPARQADRLTRARSRPLPTSARQSG